jgi:hypothetical protein
MTHIPAEERGHMKNTLRLAVFFFLGCVINLTTSCAISEALYLRVGAPEQRALDFAKASDADEDINGVFSEVDLDSLEFSRLWEAKK